MALVYTAQPVVKNQTKFSSHEGEVNKNRAFFILDANGKEIFYIRCRPHAPANVAAAFAETSAMADAIVTALNAL